MQLVARRNRPDSLADGWRDCAGNPHDHLARRQFPGIGGNALHLMLPGAVNEGLGANALDRFHGEVERDAAGDRIARNQEVLGANSQNAGFAGGAAVAGTAEAATPKATQIAIAIPTVDRPLSTADTLPVLGPGVPCQPQEADPAGAVDVRLRRDRRRLGR